MFIRGVIFAHITHFSWFIRSAWDNWKKNSIVLFDGHMIFHHILPMPNDDFEAIVILEEALNRIVRWPRDLPSYITNAAWLLLTPFDSWTNLAWKCSMGVWCLAILPISNDYFEVIEIVQETFHRIVRWLRDLPSYMTNAEWLPRSDWDSWRKIEYDCSLPTWLPIIYY